MWNSFTDKYHYITNKIVLSKNDLYPGDLPYINLKNVGSTIFKITQMQSVSILSICVHPCFSFLLLHFFYVAQQF